MDKSPVSISPLGNSPVGISLVDINSPVDKSPWAKIRRQKSMGICPVGKSPVGINQVGKSPVIKNSAGESPPALGMVYKGPFRSN